MKTERESNPVERLKREANRAFDAVDTQLARLEILTAAMVAFSRPIPDYDPGFQHQRHLTARATVLRNAR